tara:strand:+ start:16974 stop:17975 length:1002 start_codon:yes stop_codon:yes gene_type:complete
MGIRTPGSYIGHDFPTYTGEDLSWKNQPTEDFFENNILQPRLWGRRGHAKGVWKTNHIYERRMANKWPDPPEPEKDITTTHTLTPNTEHILNLPIIRIPSFARESSYTSLSYGSNGAQAFGGTAEKDYFVYRLLKLNLSSLDQLFIGVKSTKRRLCDVNIGQIQINQTSNGNLIHNFTNWLNGNPTGTLTFQWLQKIVNVGGNPSAGSGFGIGTSSTNTSSNLWGFAFQRTATPWGSGLSHGHATNLDLYNLSAGASIQQEPVAANLNNNISFRSSGTTQSNTNWLQYSALPTVNTEYQNAVTVSMTLGMVSTYKYGYDYGADNDYIRIYYTA